MEVEPIPKQTADTQYQRQDRKRHSKQLDGDLTKICHVCDVKYNRPGDEGIRYVKFNCKHRHMVRSMMLSRGKQLSFCARTEVWEGQDCGWYCCSHHCGC